MTRGVAITHLAALVIGLAAGRPRPARAQDFANPSPPPASPPAARLLEHALPAAGAGPSLAMLHVRWHDLPELSTRALVASAGFGALRGALGVSQTGDAATGWTALALGAGWAERSGGMGLRVVARRDRDGAFALDAASHAWGIEAGAGGWIALDDAWQVWASAPSLWSEGPAPPLARPLGFGLEWRGESVRAWAAHAAAPRWAGGSGAGVAGGVALRVGPAWVSASGRDHPARPALGFEIAARAARVTAEAESHPVLGTTTKLAVGFGGVAAP